MADETLLSSSEQYVKKSNRLLLLVGIGFLVAFLIALAILFSGGKQEVPQEVIEIPANPGMDINTNVTDPLLLRGEEDQSIRLVANPAQLNLENVVVGGSSEAIITLTAEKGPIRLDRLALAEVQQDGFIVEGNCTAGLVLQPGTTCNLRVLWNPVSVRRLQNNLAVSWRIEDPTAFPPPSMQTLMVTLAGQSTDSKDCIICEESSSAKKKSQGILDAETGMFVSEDGREIMGIIEPERIPIGLDGLLMGRIITTSNEVVNNEGVVLGRMLPDFTIVDKELQVLGAALAMLPVMDGNGKIVGALSGDGTVVDASGELVGLPLADGTIVGLDGRTIGSIMPWSVIINFASRAVGITQKDGSVINIEKQKIGQVLPGGLVVNATGAIIGGTVERGLAVGYGCQMMGTIQQNGKILNSFDQTVGYVTIDGLIVDMGSTPIGRSVREGIVIDTAGKITSFVNSEGKAISATADILGCLTPDGTVTAGKDAIGAVMQHGRVIGYDRQIQGVVLPNGAVVKSTGDVLGRVVSSGFASDLNGKVMGAVVPKGTAIAQGCVFLGIIDLDGRVLDPSGKSVGTVTPDKKVVNDSGEIIGGVTPSGAVVGLDGKQIGIVRPDGKVVDKTGKVIGCVNPDGTVVNEKGELIGRVEASGIPLDANGNPTDMTVIGGKVFGPNGELIGTLIDGKVVNDRGEIVGFIPPDGAIVSPEGLFLGRFSSKLGYATNAAGTKFGKVLPDFTAISADTGNIIGALIPDGSQVIDIGNARIGSIVGDASVVGLNNEELGVVRANGSVVSKEGVIMGGVMPIGSVLDWTGKVIGNIDGSGKVVDASAKEIGVITLNRTALDVNGAVIGMAFPDAVIPMGSDGKTLGFLTINGDVNKDGSPIGRITPAGNIFSTDGQMIGALVRLSPVIGNNKQVIGWLSFVGDLNDKEGKPIGKVMSDGSAVNADGQQLGHLVPRGTVVDLMGGFVGLTSVDGRVLGRTNDVLGAFPYNQNLINDKDIWVGRTLPVGAALDPAGNLIGSVRFDGMVVNNLQQVVGAVQADDRVINTSGLVIGQYVSYGTQVLNDKGRVLGAVSFDGTVKEAKGTSFAKLIGSDAMDNNGTVVGRVMAQGYVLTEQGKAKGHIAPNGSAPYKVESGETETNKLTSSLRVINKDRTIVGGTVPSGIALGLDLTVVGNTVPDGSVLFNAAVTAKLLPDATMYDTLGRVWGGVIAPNVVLDREGHIAGRTSVSNAVNGFDNKKIGTLMPYGSVLSTNNDLVGMTMRTGVAVDDFAKKIGVIGVDGAVVAKEGVVTGRVMQEGTIVQIANRDVYGVMPDIGDVVATGAAIGLKPEVVGRAMPSGDVLNTKDDVAGRILDDATLLGTDGNLMGALVAYKTAIDAQINVLGNTAGDGTVVNYQGTVIGPLASNGAVKGSHALKNLGVVLQEGLVGEMCKVIGQPRQDGRILNGKGEVVGILNWDGTAQSLRGAPLGGIVIKGTVITEDGTVLGRTLPDSNVVDKSGISIGCSRADGSVVDHDGKLLGRVLKRGLVLDENGNVIGRVLRNGSVVNAKGEVIGKVLGDGTVVDLNGNRIGRVADIKKEQLMFNEDGTIQGTFDRGGKFYDNNGKHIFTVDPDGNVYDPSGKLIGRIGDDGIIRDLDGNEIGRVGANGIIMAPKLLPTGGALGSLNIGGQSFKVSGVSILDPTGKEIVGYMGTDGIPYSLSGQSLVEELGGTGGRFGQETMKFSPEQIAQMQGLLGARRQQMKKGMTDGSNLKKLTPDARTLARAKQKQDKDFGSKTVSGWPVNMTRMILRDKAIPVVLSRSIDSRYISVPASGIVERHIYSEDGRNIIIPAGSRLIGTVTGKPGANHVAKLEISWQRLIRPDGGSFVMEAVSGDAQGRGGVAGYLDEMFLAKYGRPILQSTIVSAISYMMASDKTVTQSQDYGTVSQSDRATAAQDARENFVDDMEMIFNQMIEDAASTPPVVFVPSGTRLTVFSNEDLWLRSEDDDADDAEAELGAAPTQAQTSPFGLAQRPSPASQASVYQMPQQAAAGATQATTGDPSYQPEYTDSTYLYNGEYAADEYEQTGITQQPAYQQRTTENRVAKPLQTQGNARSQSADLF